MRKTPTKQPNILWVSFEDTNPLYPCYGDPTAKTPNLDRLAAGGCMYRNTFSTAGVCAPSRSAIITGMYPTAVGTHHMRTTHTNPATPALPTPYSALLPHYVKCFTEYFRAAGYYCSNCAKTDYQFEPPLTAFDDCSKTAHWRNRRDPAQPFFAIFNLDITHESSMWDESPTAITVDPATVPVPPYFPDTPAVRTAIARMYSNIETNDRRLGELLDQLEADGLADNTVVCHWSDHGPMPRGKRWPYDSGIHVPMILRWPGQLAPGSADPRLISTIDLASTMLSIAGLPLPQHLHSRAFLGENAAPERDYVFATRDRYDESYDMIRAVRDKRFKYLRHYHPELNYLLWVPYRNRHPIMREMWRLRLAGELNAAQSAMIQPRPAEELYDTQVDPHELNNLAADPAYRAELTRLRAALDDWIAEVGDLGRLDEATMVRGWYPDGRAPQTAPVVFVPISAQNYGRTAGEGGALPAPAMVQLYCATQGASIAYTLDTAAAADWRVYTEPIRLPPGAATIRAKAHRIGYTPGAECSASFQVTPAAGASAD